MGWVMGGGDSEHLEEAELKDVDSSECTGEMVERSWNSHGSYHGDLEVVLEEVAVHSPTSQLCLLAYG